MYILEHRIFQDTAHHRHLAWQVCAFCGKRSLLARICMDQKDPNNWRVRPTVLTCEQLMQSSRRLAGRKAA